MPKEDHFWPAKSEIVGLKEFGRARLGWLNVEDRRLLKDPYFFFGAHGNLS